MFIAIILCALAANSHSHKILEGIVHPGFAEPESAAVINPSQRKNLEQNFGYKIKQTDKAMPMSQSKIAAAEEELSSAKEIVTRHVVVPAPDIPSMVLHVEELCRAYNSAKQHESKRANN